MRISKYLQQNAASNRKTLLPLGKGSSRRKAEQAAAEVAFKQLSDD